VLKCGSGVPSAAKRRKGMSTSETLSDAKMQELQNRCLDRLMKSLTPRPGENYEDAVVASDSSFLADQ
jgi:hypothetical protein